ncbi:MAG: amidase [Actinomycetota bacterium]|nr:amidase [Actinomycetota bacterium]
MRSIADIAGSVRSGDSTAVETITAALDAAEASQPDLNAFTAIDRDRALASAARVDEQIASGHNPGALAGVPMGLKDLIDQAGIPTTNGAVFETTPAAESATVVQRLEGAGAVIIGRTGLHEFAFGFTSENQHYGPVRNPWDLSLSPGGSSGGSAAAVAAGIVPAAIGTDTGGSIRVPAALCGVVGLKVTHGRVPLTGTTPLAPSLDTVGPIARSVADAAAIYLAIAGDDAMDPWSAPVRVDRPGAPRDPSTLFVGVPRQWMEHPVDRVTRDAFRDVLERFTALGATIETVDEPILEITEASANAAAAEVYQVHKERWEAEPERYGTDVAARIRRAQTIGLDAATDAMAWDAGVRHSLDRIFGRFDVLITPTVGSTRKTIGEDDMDIDGERIFHRAVIAQYTWPVNRAGNPALALPIESAGTPPSSLQLIGPRWAESSLLAIGLGLEEAGIVKVENPPTFFA